MEFLQSFKAARRVSTPLIAVRTFDAKSTTNLITDSLNGKKDETPLLVWDVIHGLVPLTNTKASKDALAALIAGVDQLATVPLAETLRMLENDEVQDAITFVANAHLQWKNEPAIIQGIWNLRDSYKANGNMLVLLTTPGAQLPPELANDVLVLDEPLPTVADLQKTVTDTYKFAKVTEPSADTVEDATNALIGLPAFAAEQATAMCLNITTSGKNRTGELNISDLWDRKRQIINEAPGLSVYTGKETMDDIGGVVSAKEFVDAVMAGKNAPKTIIFLDEIEKAFAGTGTDMSGTKTELTGSMLSWMQDKGIKGMIFIGIPGVSKSALAKAAGGTHGVPVINFDLAGMQGSLVGESGANLRAAQATVDAISGGSVLAIATCNGIESIPPELRRRFSLATFFFDAPSREEKDVIWSIHRKRYSIPAGQLNPADEGWTGAEIEQCCMKAEMLEWTLEKSATYIVPIAISSKDKIAKTRSDASGKYLSASKPGIYYAGETVEAKPGLMPPVRTTEPGRRIRD
jgi:hypothetical protein